MAKASQDIADSLHELVFTSIQDEIQGYRDRCEPIPPALLSAAIKLLKDNGVEVAGGNEAPRVKQLAVTLPFPSKDVLKSVQ
jgi:hypothetical protein